MRFLLAATLMLSMTPPTSAQIAAPFGWERCTTALSGHAEKCLNFLNRSCPNNLLKLCQIQHTQAWLGFGFSQAIARAQTTGPFGKQTDRAALARNLQIANSLAGDCAEDDIDCLFTKIITNALKEYGPTVDAE